MLRSACPKVSTSQDIGTAQQNSYGKCRVVVGRDYKQKDLVS